MKILFKDNRGHIALYTLLFIPIALTFTTIAIDVSAWNSLRDKLQQEADSIALQAVYLLPDKEAAEQSVNDIAKGNRLKNMRASAFFPPDDGLSIGVRLKAKYKPNFDFFLKLIGATPDNLFEVERQAIARLVPSDFVFIVADGSSLRPGIVRGEDGKFQFSEPWGDATAWPASGFFNCTLPPNIYEEEVTWAWWEEWEKVEFKRWLTQSCFNPVFSKLKLSVISVVDNLIISPGNRIAVIFTPGNPGTNGYSVLRHIHGTQDDSNLYPAQIGGFIGTSDIGAEAHWKNYVELERLSGDEACLLFSDPTTAFNNDYSLPTPPPYLIRQTQSSSICTSAITSPPCGERYFPIGNMNQCFLTHSLSLREALYWHAARLSINGLNAKPDILAALRQSLEELTGSSGENGSKYATQIRGNLAASALRRVFVFTDTLFREEQHPEEIKALLASYQSHNLELFFVVFEHFGLNTTEKANLKDKLSLLKKITGDNNYSHTKIFFAESPEALQSTVVPKLLPLTRRAVLRT